MGLLRWTLISILVLVVLALLYWRFWFLRQPARATPEEGIVSPASGTLVRIIRYEHGEPQEVPKGRLGIVRTLTSDVAEQGYLLVIVLSPLDVHYQRAPLPGTVVRQRYTPGGFHNAVRDA